MRVIVECQKKIAGVIFGINDGRALEESKFDVGKCPLVDLTRFGKEKTQIDTDFRWPTLLQLKKLNLSGPPKLKEIRTCGESDSGLTTIQLIFEDGLESELIDCENANAEEMMTFEINQYKVPNQIMMRVYENTWPYHL